MSATIDLFVMGISCNYIENTWFYKVTLFAACT